MFVNVGCFDSSGQRIKTKKLLKELLASDPKSVVFDRTVVIGVAGTLTLEELPPGTTLSVVGPDPASDRRWFAFVSRQGEGVTIT